MLGEGALRSAQLLFVGEDWRGTPAYQGRLTKGKELDPSLGTKIASLQFPDVRSCLDKDASNPWLIDWEKINNSRQAKVCIFRILHEVNEIEDAVTRLRAQGFRVFANNILKGRGDPVTRRLYGHWSILRDGPRFDSMRTFTYFLPKLATKMAVVTHWHETDDQLVFVGLDYKYK